MPWSKPAWTDQQIDDIRGLIQLGLVLLIATPVARMAFTTLAFAPQRDKSYLVVTLIALALLVYSLLDGHR